MPEVDAAETDALVLYTSGSTSAPKAVPLRQRALVSNGFHIGARLGLSAADRVLLASPLFWAYGSANAVPARCASRRADPALIARWVSAWAASASRVPASARPVRDAAL